MGNFNQYISGKSNNAAIEAIRDVLSGRKMHNPLFIVGPINVGKTTLLRAIKEEIQNANPEKSVLNIVAEDWVEELVSCIKKKVPAREAMIEKYKKYDYILLDEIQALTGKDATQAEMTRVFDAVINGGGQLIVASNQHISRFPIIYKWSKSIESTCYTHIGEPDRETMVQILRMKNDSEIIPEDVLELLAEQSSPIRLLNYLIARASLMNEEITVDHVHKLLKESIDLQ